MASLMNVLIVDASEPTEISIYLVNGRTMPSHMRRQIERNGQRSLGNVYEDWGTDGLAGLVDEESESADDRVEEVWEWLHASTTPEFKFEPSDGRVLVTHTLSIVTV